MNAHTPLHMHPDLSDAVLEQITGVKVHKREEVPFYGLKQKAKKGSALKLRPSNSPGGEPNFLIVDALTKEQRIALGKRKSRVRIATGCRESERDAAAEKLIGYERDKRSKVFAHVRPGDVPISAVLLAYQAHLDHGAHKLKPGSVKTYSHKIVPLAEYFGAMPLGALTPNVEKDFERWRTRQTVCGLGGKPISATEVGLEIGQLRSAINHFRRSTQLNLPIMHYVPERDTAAVIWWRRWEIALYLWSCRGRISLPVKDANGAVVGWRWMVARDVDPTLTGPEGDRRVVRPREDIERRMPQARLVRLGIHAPSRAKVLIQAVYRESAKGSYVSLVEGALRRMPIGPDNSNKRRPPAPLGPKLTGLVIAWGRGDHAPNAYRTRPAAHLIHQVNGEPCSESFLGCIRDEILADCAVDKPMGVTYLRHSAAMWMKIEGVSLWISADRLGITARVCEERYGTWDNLGIYEATQALCRGTRQKEAMRRAKAEGVLFMM